MVGKVLLIGVTGGTGGNVVKGFVEQNLTDLRTITREVNLERPALARLNAAGVELVQADLDDPSSLVAAFEDVAAVYCHALAADSAKPDPQELERARWVAEVAKQAQIQHLVFNSAGGADRQTGIDAIEQKHRIEQIFQQAGLLTTMLRACLFMEEFWKKYTRPSILKGSFPFSVPSNKPLHLITTKDMGRVAAYVMQHRSDYVGRSIELAGDVLTPAEMAAEFARIQGKSVIHKDVPPWIFLLFLRFPLFRLIQWYRNKGYEADVPALRQEFPGLLTSFREFLAETQWADPALSYGDL